MKIYLDVDTMHGRPLYGHLEGEIDFSEEDEKDFLALLEKERKNEEELTEDEADRLQNYKDDILYYSYPVVDDWEFDSYDGVDWESF